MISGSSVPPCTTALSASSTSHAECPIPIRRALCQASPTRASMAPAREAPGCAGLVSSLSGLFQWLGCCIGTRFSAAMGAPAGRRQDSTALARGPHSSLPGGEEARVEAAPGDELAVRADLEQPAGGDDADAVGLLGR